MQSFWSEIDDNTPSLLYLVFWVMVIQNLGYFILVEFVQKLAKILQFQITVRIAVTASFAH
jgi:hypothetical protein